VAGLMSLIKDDSSSKNADNARNKATGALENLAGFAENRLTIGKFPGIFDSLLTVFEARTSSVETQSHIAGFISRYVI
jgi:hypothetical protein